MKFSVTSLYPLIFLHFLIFSAFADTNSVENLLSDDSSSNNTDATDGKITIEEQYDEDHNQSSSVIKSSSTGPSSISSVSSQTSSFSPETTTKKSGKPRAPSFAGWSFFIGIVVAFLLIGIAVAVFKFFCHSRRPGNNVQYTAYQ